VVDGLGCSELGMVVLARVVISGLVVASTTALSSLPSES
jgi:hypothetical protein